MTTTDAFLAHYGIRGMRWGVRKSATTSPRVATPREQSKLKPNEDGSITIPKGSKIQRVVNGRRLLSKAGSEIGDTYTYASFTQGDNLRYEKYFGIGKNILVKDASRVLTLTAKTDLKSPSPGETSKIFWENLKNNPADLKIASDYLRKSPMGDHKALDRALLNPDTKEAYSTFGFMFDTSIYGANRVQNISKSFVNELTKRGYNTIVDPSDSTWGGMYDAPIVIFGGSKNLEVSVSREVTRHSAKEVSAILKEHSKIDTGKRLMQRLGYDD